MTVEAMIQVNIRMRPEEADALRDQAKASGMGRDQYVRRALGFLSSDPTIPERVAAIERILGKLVDRLEALEEMAGL